MLFRSSCNQFVTLGTAVKVAALEHLLLHEHVPQRPLQAAYTTYTHSQVQKVLLEKNREGFGNTRTHTRSLTHKHSKKQTKLHTCLWLTLPHSLHSMLLTVVPWYSRWMSVLPLVPTRECSRALKRILFNS